MTETALCYQPSAAAVGAARLTATQTRIVWDLAHGGRLMLRDGRQLICEVSGGPAYAVRMDTRRLLYRRGLIARTGELTYHGRAVAKEVIPF